MPEESNKGYLPNIDQISTISATILLAYTLERFFNFPNRELSTQLPGIYINITLNIQTLAALLIAGLTASGTNWLLQSHPTNKKKNTVEHWLLPAMTALVIAIPLFQVPQRLIWWIGFGAGGFLIIVIIIAEYISINPKDKRFSYATGTITSVAFVLFLIFATAMNYAEARLIWLFPALMLSGFLVSLRVFRLHIHDRWFLSESFIISLITTQIATALHYLPISPITFGLATLAPAYALTNLFINLKQTEEPTPVIIIESVVILNILWLVAFWIR
jgi:hypothetical protein